MTEEEKIIYNCSDSCLNILDTGRSDPVYTILDLSRENAVLSDYDITDAGQCQAYIDLVLHRNNADLAHGGYMEQRDLYKKSEHFRPGAPPERDIHLGVDLWMKAGTAVKAPLEGTIHSFNDNAGFGNYGPAIILEHFVGGQKFYTLYGHLSR
ncbi:MAG: peptidoglycan DD-metalloendopeptidase family protein, partial [Flavobacteriaceae bacterium]